MFLDILYDHYKANVEVFHKETLFTPLTWLAINGDCELIKKILPQYKRCAFVPDANGYFPIDYAGRFNHKESVLALVKHSIEQHKELVAKKGSDHHKLYLLQN